MLVRITIKQAWLALIIFIFSAHSFAQQIAAPDPETGSVVGTVTDVNNDVVPGAMVILDGPAPSDHRSVLANEGGFFELAGIHPAVSYKVKVTAKGFADWTTSAVVLKPGEYLELKNIKLTVSALETTVTAIYDTTEIATEQVKVEEKQRVLGVVPNFYVVYDREAVPLTTKLKYQLALKAGTDVVTIAGAAFLAGINQAADTPDYVQGAKGYGQRFGAAFADGFSDIMIGGAILPSLLHQDPRYFYQGTGTTKSRLLHAVSAPFICKGDNGREQFNYSSIGGDLASGALSNLYYPASNRGPGLVFSGALITTGGRIANALAQEFILRKFTPSAKGQP
jgi:Carboxypeptidase regulatory-like domain